MVSLRKAIQNALVSGTQDGQENVPEEAIVASCLTAGFDEGAVAGELDKLVEEEVLWEENGKYARIGELINRI